MITFLDDYSRWTWVYFLKQKSNAYKTFREWKAETKKSSGQTLIAFHSDNGHECLNNEWMNYMKTNGIRWETSSPHTPEQNGAAERLNRSIFDCVRTVLADTGLPLYLWAEAANYIAYTRNRHTTRALLNSTPYQQWYGNVPNLSHLHRFGCMAYIYNQTWNKLELTGRRVTFVEYVST